MGCKVQDPGTPQHAVGGELLKLGLRRALAEIDSSLRRSQEMRHRAELVRRFGKGCLLPKHIDIGEQTAAACAWQSSDRLHAGRYLRASLRTVLLRPGAAITTIVSPQ